MVAGCRIELLAFRLLAILDRKQSTRGMRPGGPGNQYWVVYQLSFGLTPVFAIETFDAAGGIDQLLFAGEERMTAGAYLKPDFRLCRPGLPGLAARTVYGGVHVFWMNVRLHFRSYSRCEFFRRSNVKG